MSQHALTAEHGPAAPVDVRMRARSAFGSMLAMLAMSACGRAALIALLCQRGAGPRPGDG